MAASTCYYPAAGDERAGERQEIMSYLLKLSRWKSINFSSLVKSFSGWNVGIISSSCSPKKPRLWRCASLSLISLSRFYLPRKVSTDQDKRQELCNWRGITTLWFRQRKVIQIMLMQFEEYLVCVCSWEGANWEDLICLLIWRQNIWQSQGKAGGGKR